MFHSTHRKSIGSRPRIGAVALLGPGNPLLGFVRSARGLLLLAALPVLALGLAQVVSGQGSYRSSAPQSARLLPPNPESRTPNPGSGTPHPAPRTPNPEPHRAHLAASYGELPLSFEPNVGQAGAPVQFLSRGCGYTLFLSRSGAVLELSKGRQGDKETGRQGETAAVLNMRLLRPTGAAAPTAEDRLPGRSNYFIGKDPARWRTNVANYGKVRFPGVYPGVDLVYYGNQRQLEYDFVVAPGADPGRIGMEMSGAPSAVVNKKGDLTLHTGGGDLAWRKPAAYQIVDGKRQPVECSYQIDRQSPPAHSSLLTPHSSLQGVRFQLGSYNHKRPLIIDPVLVYSTYLGGSSGNTATAIAIDSSGDAYVSGYTSSMDFPTTTGADDTTFGSGSQVAFVSELNPSGTALLYSTFLGGSDSSQAAGIAVDSNGSATVAGSTTSSDFPTTAGAYQTVFAGGSSDAFVTRLSAGGSSLVYSTFVGGSSGDAATAVALDSSGNAYVTGSTQSPDFPTSTGAYQTGLHGQQNAFVSKLNSSGGDLLYSTYLGGGSTDSANAIAVDTFGFAYVTGSTTSTDFPTTPGAYENALDGQQNAFVTRLFVNGTFLVYSTYLGGNTSDQGNGIAVDFNHDAYVTGYSSSGNFPTTPGAFQTQLTGPQQAFVTELTGSGSPFYSTYLGGSSGGGANAIAVDSYGSAFITGYTTSADFPTTAGAYQTALAGQQNGFVTELRGDGTVLLYSTYLGGSSVDQGNGIAVDSSGGVYVTGYSASGDFPITQVAYQAQFTAPQQAFLTKLNLAPAPLPPTATTVTSSMSPSAFGQSVTFTATVSGAAAPTGSVIFLNGSFLLGIGALSNGIATLSVGTLAAGSHSITTQYIGDASNAGSTSPAITQTVGLGATTTVLSSALNPSTFGQSVTLTADVTGASLPTGTVTFLDGTTTLGSGDLVNGLATFSLTTLSVGTHSITASYSGDANDTASSSAPILQGISVAASTTTLTSSGSPSAPGQSVTLTANVSGVTGALMPTGTVTFKDGAGTIGSGDLADGAASFSLTTLSPGTHSLKAVYNSDASYGGSTSPVLTQRVLIASNTTVASSTSPSAFGQSVTLTATVTGADGSTPAGSVTFLDGAKSLGAVSLSNGTAALSLTTLAVGSRSITAIYHGNSTHAGSASPALTQSVIASSTTALNTSRSSPAAGVPVTLTAAVSSAARSLAPTGSVTFYDGAAPIGSPVTLAGGPAQLPWTFNTVGSHSITAVYSGDTNFTSSASTAVSEMVAAGTASLTLTAAAGPYPPDQAVSFTAQVTGPNGSFPGTVTLEVGTAAADTESVNGAGQASLSWTPGVIGAYTVKAAYSGDPNFKTATSKTLTITVSKNSTTASLTISNPTPGQINSAVAVIATVGNGSATLPTGSVTFTDTITTAGVTKTTRLGTFGLAGGVASGIVSLTTPGSNMIKASYAGDGLNLPASASTTVNLSASPTSTTLTSSLNPSTYGASVSFTAAVTSAGGGTPTGSVTFYDGGATGTSLGSKTLSLGSAALSVSTLSGGSHSIVAVYTPSGTSFLTSSSSALSQMVSTAATTTTLAAAAAPTGANQPVNFTATVAGPGSLVPTGSVTLNQGATVLDSEPLVGNTASLSWTPAAAGPVSLTAVYSGDANFSPGASKPITVTVPKCQTTITFTLTNPTPGQINAAMSVSASVTSEPGVPITGSVKFTDQSASGATVVGIIPLTGGAVSGTVAITALGTNGITASYAGDTLNAPSSSSPTTLTLAAASTTTTLTSSLNPTSYGAPVALTATLASTSGLTPRGSVDFYDGGTSGVYLGTVNLTGGAAVLNTSSLSLGDHSIAAVYTPTVSYVASASAPLTQTVIPAATSVALVSSVNPSSYRAAVKLTATVTATGGATPAGSVTFYDGGTTGTNLGTVNLTGKTANLSISSLSPGSHSLTAVYTPFGVAGAFVGGSSAILTQDVT